MSALIDARLPVWDFREVHETSVEAPPEVVYEALTGIDLNSLWLTRILLAVRGIPSLGKGWSRGGSELTLRGLTELGFVTLEEDAPSEIVLGLVGQPWALTGDIRRVDAEGFDAVDDPSVAKVVWNFRLDVVSEGTTILVTETRTRCLGDDARRRFRRYWRLVRPFSGVIRIEILQAVKRAAELRSGEEMAS